MSVLTGDLLKDILAISITLILIIYVFLKRRFTYWANKGVECLPPTIPFGNAKDLLFRRSTFGELFKEAYKKFKSEGLKCFGFYLLYNPVFVIIDPELIKTVMTKDFQHFTDHGVFVDEEREPLTGHLFALEGLKWKNLRAKLTPTFTSGKMKMMFYTLVDCSKGLIEVVDNTINAGKALDIKDVVARYTTDVIGTCAFGLDCNSLKNPDSEFRKYGKTIFETSVKQLIARTLATTCPTLLRVFNLTFLNRESSEFFLKIIKETVNYRENNNISRKDFMHLLIQLKNNVKVKDEEHVESLIQLDESTEVGKSLTINQLSAQAFVFFFAGFETSSTALTFCLYELVANREIQEKLRNEINTVLGKHNGEITYDGIMEMTYMDKCIQETLRKYPPIPLIFRKCTRMYKVPDSGIIVDKGIRTFIPIYDIQHDPEYYPDPEKFDPERFSAENKADRHPFVWLPFGEGPRACIGLRFGLMQTKAALTCLLKNYKFTLNSKTHVPLKMSPKSAVLAAEGDIWLNAEKI
ncbi:hypothetical protein ILUMI_05233 [Ignelater luminosus]|uniref:Cytochrome P450 n=1 Tax=Ignelater luminosus TaxID=2038154 RepID=A0A8K0DDC0_IGNLU|nr:hypothetical protein ILUMI_05233 [Ignelater luminosus]